MTHPKKILIIDDEIDLCILLKNYLENRNFVVHCAHSLKEGMRLMEDAIPDILFLDNNLPDGTGWSHSSFFFSVNPELKLYLMSGFQPVQPELPSSQFGVINKPISFSDLEFLAKEQ